ncbi:flagellar biogenesis protein FliO [Allocatelliglobosispora scoriae]|uniref:Flagellar biogenesis protein FliO n=1 Tax=Allocatelliglobosispora scoriae TaxID=643052 RepID=A0A841BNC7_9ACTN|nr:hypothetical protein [Allocatelliglobosispora scoriae]MBB5868888.1 flagellar biogenesis protein FliO [Allocatelliglobosispora scoriae]
MAVRVVHDVEGGSGLRGVLRAIAVLLGVVLIVVGIVAAVFPLIYILLTASDLLQGNSVSSLDGNDAVQLLVLIAVSLLGFWLGLRFIRGRRRTGLYLRKFGFADTTRTVSHALNSAVGRSVRLVTLDDSMVAPIGAGHGRRRFAGFVWFITGAGVLLLVIYLVGGGYSDSADSLMEQTASQAGDGFGESVLAAGVGALFGALLLIMVVGFAVIVGLIALLGGGSYLAARRAERAASQVLRNEGDVDATARRIARLGRRIFAPRLVVIAVPTAFWQHAVRGLARVSEVVVIDVSQPTDALVWEVQNIKPLFQGRWVLVGARDRVAALAQPGTAMLATPLGLLARMLDAEEVIAYGPTPEDRKRFARALRNKLAMVQRR